MLKEIVSVHFRSDKRAHRKWSEKITQIASRHNSNSHQEENFRFLYRELQECTQSYLAKRNLTQDEIDNVCYDQVMSHQDKIVALAACTRVVSDNSRTKMLEYLASIYPSVDSTHLAPTYQRASNYVTERYCRAFLTIWFGNDDEANKNDVQWAEQLVEICSKNTASAATDDDLRRIIRTICTLQPPGNFALQGHVRLTVESRFATLGKALNAAQSQKDWISCISYARFLREQLSQLDVEGVEIASNLEVVLDGEVPHWRAWRRWGPDSIQLSTWRHIRFDKFLCPLWELLGPDTIASRDEATSPGIQLVERQCFATWLAEKGFEIGTERPTLFHFTKEGDFMLLQRLMSVVDVVCRGTDSLRKFFKEICRNQKLGINLSSLEMCMKASPACSRSHAFLIKLHRSDRIEISEWSEGLELLNADAMSDVRNHLSGTIEEGFQTAFDEALLEFKDYLYNMENWILSAEKVVACRRLRIQYAWLKRGNAQQSIQTTSCFKFPDALRMLYEFSTAIASRNDELRQWINTCVFHMVSSTVPDEPSMAIIRELHRLWREDWPWPERNLGVSIAAITTLDLDVRLSILKTLAFASKEYTELIQAVLEQHASKIPFEALRRFVAAVARDPAFANSTWQTFVTHVLEQHNVSAKDYMAYEGFTFSDFFKWIKDVQVILEDKVSPTLANWLHKLSGFEATLNCMNSLTSSPNAVSFIVEASEPDCSDILAILGVMRRELIATRKSLMEAIFLQSAEFKDASSALSFVEIVSSLPTGTRDCIPDHGIQRCVQVIALSKTEPAEVVATQLNIWRQDSELGLPTKSALGLLASALRLPPEKPETAGKYLTACFASLLDQAKAMGYAASQFRRKDIQRYIEMTERLGIDQNASLLQEMIKEVPFGIISQVEEVDETNVHLYFSTSNVRALQLLGMGVGRGKSLVVRLKIDKKGIWQSYCVHIQSAFEDLCGFEHNPATFKAGLETTIPACRATHSRLEYMVFINLRRLLVQARPNINLIVRIYEAIENSIQNFGNCCLMCTSTLGCDRYRPTICDSALCREQFLQTDAILRLSDRTLDAPLAILLCCTLYAATLSPMFANLLPNRPRRLSHNVIQNAFNTLSASESPRISIHEELLLSYACNEYKGFLVSATGPWRIPNLPNIQQFLMADNPPSVMAAFRKHDHRPRKVLFHGTTLDRLYAILSQGLQVQSNTCLRANGASFGKGIYLASSPRTASSYSKPMSGRTHVISHRYSDCMARGVLLAIESAGVPTRVSDDIHLEADWTRLLLRYVFLVPAHWQPPIAGHIVPALKSNFASLQSGTRKADRI